MPVGALHCIEKEICTPCNEIEELDFIALLGRNYISSVCGILFRSELIFDTRFDEAVSMGEDLCFIFEALHRAKNRELKATPEAYYNYRMHAGSLTTTCDEQRINGLKKTYECLYSELSRRNFTGGAYKKFVSKRLLSDIYYLSHVVESSSLCVEEKEKRRVDLAKVNLLRKRDFAKSADTGHSYKLLTVQLSCSLFYFKAQKNLDRYTSALQRRIGRR